MTKYIKGTHNDDHLVGTHSNDVFIGSAGNDTIDGKNSADVVDYSNLSQAVTMKAYGITDKGHLGSDRLINIEEVIGATGKANTIDASDIDAQASIDVNLGHNRLTVRNIPHIGDRDFTVKNFVNVVGTHQADKIVGDDRKITTFKGAGGE